MLELIEKLEKAAGPDRELDLLIGEAVGAADHSGQAYDRPFRDWAKHYTRSIDAALTLAPEGWYWSGDSRGCAIVGSEFPPPATDYCGIVHGHKSPAIALCIAALKARVASTTSVKAGDVT